MYKLDEKIISFLKSICETSPNLLVKGGSSLLIRNYELNKGDYRLSTDIDITVIGPSKNKGPSSQYDPKKNRLNTMLDELGIKYDYRNVNPRRSIYSIKIDKQEFALETSVPKDNEYEDYDVVLGIRVARLAKVIADKIMIMIEYHSDRSDIWNRYMRHWFDVAMMEEWYSYSLIENKEEIINNIKLRMVNNHLRYEELYKGLLDGWMEFKNDILMYGGNYEYADEFIKNIFNSKFTKSIVNDKNIKIVESIIKEVRYEKV